MRSPGGSVYPYYYKGGEIHCLKYGSMYKDEAKLARLMALEEEFVAQTRKKLRIWIDLYKTSLREPAAEALVEHLTRMHGSIVKLSFVGVSGFGKWRLLRKVKRQKLDCPVSFFSDPEDAKTWLVSERA